MVHGIALASAKCDVMPSRYTVEFGVVREASGIKAFGAGKPALQLCPCPSLLFNLEGVKERPQYACCCTSCKAARLTDCLRLVCRHSVKLWRDGAHGAGARKAAAL